MQVNVSRVEAITILATLLQPQHAILGAQLIEAIANSEERTVPPRYAAFSVESTLVRPRKTRGKAKAVASAPKASEAAPAKQKPAKAAKRATAGVKRSADDIAALADRIRQHVTAHPGQGAEQIGAALGVDTKTMALPVKKLLADKFIRTEGVKRATKYFSAGKASKATNGVAATAAE